MTQQISFSEIEYDAKKKQTRRDVFLAKMETIVPFARLVALIAPHYPTSGRRGRPPLGIERMLRMYFVQQWYALADEAVEDALYDSQALRRFCGIDLAVESVPDATTLMKFRHRLEANQLSQAMLNEVNALLKEKKLLMSQGTLIDATLIAAPCSTKNRARERDPEMHSVKKGNQWYFGMRAHIGVDESSGLVHTVVSTAAHTSEVSQVASLLHGEESRVGADAGYVGAAKRPEVIAKLAETGQAIGWCIARRRQAIHKMADGWQKQLMLAAETLKARVRARVEHPFHVIKNLFHHRKTRYRGLAKNHAQVVMLFALANLYLVREKLRP